MATSKPSPTALDRIRVMRKWHDSLPAETVAELAVNAFYFFARSIIFGGEHAAKCWDLCVEEMKRVNKTVKVRKPSEDQKP